MQFLKYMLGAIIGAFFGSVGSVLLLYPLFVAANGGRDMNGGIAMGMVTVIAPAGLLLGTVAGVLLVNHLSNRKATEADKTPIKGPFVTVGVILALVMGYFGFLTYLQGPAKISFASNPEIHFEIRTTVKSLAQDSNFEITVDLFNHRDDTAVPVEVNIQIEGELAFIKGSFRMDEEARERALRAHLAPNLLLSMNLPLYPGFEMVPGKTEWDAVDFIKQPLTGGLEAAFAQKEHMYRYEAVPDPGNEG